VELVLNDLKIEYPDAISLVWLCLMWLVVYFLSINLIIDLYDFRTIFPLLQVKLYGLLHSDDDYSALEVEIPFFSTIWELLSIIISSMIQLTISFWFFKEIARQLCLGHKFSFSKTVGALDMLTFACFITKKMGLILLFCNEDMFGTSLICPDLLIIILWWYPIDWATQTYYHW
jgi:hypothetical protein